MHKSIIFKGIPAILSMVIALAIFTTDILAAEEGTVTATVTATSISLTVSDGTVEYLTVGVGQTKDTTTNATTGVDDSQTANNNGNVAEDFNIKGVDTLSWALAGTAGSETYFHKWCISDCDGTATWTAMTTSYTTLASGIAKDADQIFDLQIGTPTTTAVFTEQSPNVTIQAVEAA
ncbi:TPA: hypothetical protein DEP90_01235 [Patescibacteria group bacterium]|nr:hypothetical protein [Patescibacteria group bacterium]